MAKKSGGQLLHIKRQTVVKSSVLTQTVAEGVTALLLSVVKKSRSASYVFTIDRTITKFTVSVTGYNSLSRLMRPDGSQYWQDRLSRSGHSLVTVPEKDVLVGEWTVTVLRSPLEHTVTVQAATSIDFLYQFVELAGRPGHLGVFPIIGQPVEGGLSKVVLTVAGMAGLREVTELNVMTESGDIIDTLNSSWLEVGRRGSSNMFGVAFTTPKASFRLAMTAVDETGTVVRRLANTIVTAQPFKTRLDSQSNQVVKPGNRSDVTFKVYPSADESDVEISMNIEETSLLEDPMIDVIIQEADGSLVPLRKKRQTADLSTSKIRELKTVVTLKKGQVALVNVSFTVSKTAETGHVSSATIIIASGKSFNYVPVELVTAPPVDDKTPPRCDIVGHTGCNSDLTNETCDDHTWHVDARVVDLELGLLNIRSEHLAVNVSHSKFDKNNTLPVDVKAVASCCHRQVSLHTSDIVGNVQTCSVSLPPLKSIRKTEVTLPPTVKLATPRQKPPISSKDCKHQWERDDFVEAIMKQYLCQVSGLSADAKLMTVQFNFHVKRMLVNNSFLDADINRNGELSSDEVQQFVFSLYKRSLVDQVECLLEFIERCRAERDRLDIHVWRECAEKGNMMTPTTQPIPTTDTPTTDAPTTDTATTDTPTTDAPTTDTPTTDASTTETATTDAPTTETATTDAPTTETATTDAPTTDIPTTDAPTTDTATQQRPTTAQITQSSKGCQEPLESDLIEQGMKAYLRLILGLSADTKLTEKQFSPVIRDLVVKNWFRDADLDGNSLLSSSELKQFARSLSERKLTDGAECVLASMERCRGDKKYLDTDGWAACSEKAGALTPSSID
ncbi:uncharacterized protein LOC134191079 [Corticium candelabrum]|uniref:uncharacterized protein LOC134191079 n=1 Tax=Corticium candelabrum TaxID=121492 RepID=UPI002E25EC9C|nr:uncharacterized protein LOC134191079 [Corticium candelabrum]